MIYENDKVKFPNKFVRQRILKQLEKGFSEEDMIKMVNEMKMENDIKLNAMNLFNSSKNFDHEKKVKNVQQQID